MKIQFDTRIVGEDGKDIPLNDAQDHTLLKDVCVRALSSPLRTDEQEAAEAAFKRYELYARLYKGGEQEITSAEATMMQQRIMKVFAIPLSGPAYKLLNGK